MCIVSDVICMDSGRPSLIPPRNLDKRRSFAPEAVSPQRSIMPRCKSAQCPEVLDESLFIFFILKDQILCNFQREADGYARFSKLFEKFCFFPTTGTTEILCDLIDLADTLHMLSNAHKDTFMEEKLDPFKQRPGDRRFRVGQKQFRVPWLRRCTDFPAPT